MLWFFLTNLLAIIIIVSIVGLVAAIILDAHNKRRPEAVEFAKGQTPDPLPNGPWQGSGFGGLGKGWRGKRFDAGASSGVNMMGTGDKYDFRISVEPGLTNHALKVLRLDYNCGSNPLLLRWLIKDELVLLEPDRMLGKIQFCLPGETLTLGYFRLQQDKA